MNTKKHLNDLLDSLYNQLEYVQAQMKDLKIEEQYFLECIVLLEQRLENKDKKCEKIQG